MSDATRYSIGDLAQQAGISRRTVRFYVQRGLLPAPLGRGRGEHYDHTHLEAVLRIKALQEQGETLEAIGKRLAGVAEAGPPRAPLAGEPARLTSAPKVGEAHQPYHETPPLAAPGQVWVRQVVLPGVELHVQGSERALSERQLAALARFIHELEQNGGDR